MSASGIMIVTGGSRGIGAATVMAAGRAGYDVCVNYRSGADQAQALVDELQAMASAAITRPERYLAVIAEGDEVLDWREMRDRYADCAMRVLPRDAPGSDHALSRFELQMPEVLAFAGLSAR